MALNKTQIQEDEDIRFILLDLRLSGFDFVTPAGERVRPSRPEFRDDYDRRFNSCARATACVRELTPSLV